MMIRVKAREENAFFRFYGVNMHHTEHGMKMI